MADIIRTWPAVMTARKVREVFTHNWRNFFFTLGRGKPKQELRWIYWTHRGRIVGHFDVGAVVENTGQFPKLRSISGETSEWQIRLGNWVAICPPPFYPLRERIFHEAFRGWRYFDLESYRGTIDATVRI